VATDLIYIVQKDICFITINGQGHLCVSNDGLFILVLSIGIAFIYFVMKKMDQQDSFSGPHPLVPFLWKDFTKEENPRVFKQRKSMMVLMLWIFSGILIYKVGALFFS
jgi:hypothetical protein